VGYEEYASISIIGKPEETYTITSRYKWGGEDVTVVEKGRQTETELRHGCGRCGQTQYRELIR